MKIILLILTSLTLLCNASEEKFKDVSNQYLSASIPNNWSLEVVSGKDGETQLSIKAIIDKKEYHISSFAYWGNLDPKKFINPNNESFYRIQNKHYYQYKSAKTCIIITGKKYKISFDLEHDLPIKLKIKLLNIINTLKAN